MHNVCRHWWVSTNVKTVIGVITSGPKSVDVVARPVHFSLKIKGLEILASGQSNTPRQGLKYTQLQPNVLLKRVYGCVLLPKAKCYIHIRLDWHLLAVFPGYNFNPPVIGQGSHYLDLWVPTVPTGTLFSMIQSKDSALGQSNNKLTEQVCDSSFI